MKRITNLGANVWPGNAGNIPTQLQPIPDGIAGDSYRVSYILLKGRVTATTGAGGGYTAIELLEWLLNINLVAGGHTFTALNGLDLFLMNFYRYPGNAFSFPPAVAADQTDDVNFFDLWIPFEDRNQFQGTDFVVPAAFFNDGQLNVHYGGAALNANTTITACTIDIYAMIERKNEVQVPALPLIQSSVHDMFDHLVPGVYSDLFIRKPSDAFAAAANYTSLKVTAAGEDILQSIDPEAALLSYAIDKGWDLATVGALSWEEGYASMYFIPLIWQAQNQASNKLGNLVDSMGETLALHFLGSATAPRLVYRVWSGIDNEQAKRLLAKIGAANPAGVILKRKPASKGDLPGDDGGAKMARVSPGMKVMPLKVAGAVAPSDLGRMAPRLALQPGGLMKRVLKGGK